MPLIDSGHRWGDLILHDGEPVGSRLLDGREVPVFEEIEILEPSSLRTFQVEVEAPESSDLEALLDLLTESDLGAEDWSTVRYLCRACSEGLPHTQHSQEPAPWTAARTLGVAALSELPVRRLLRRWSSGRPGRGILSVRQVL